MTDATELAIRSGSASRSFPSPWRLLAVQTEYQLRYFFRVPAAFFFTLLLPVIMLVLFNAFFGDGTIETPEGSWEASQFFTGGLAAYTVATATYTNLANMVPIRRDEGVLRRWRGTPLPTWLYIAGFVCSSLVIALIGVTVMLTAGVLFYDISLTPAKLPAAIVTFLVGVVSFAALGMAVAALVQQAQSAAAVANATMLPLAFVSDVFIQTDDPPRWVEIVGDVFPLKPFVNSFQDCFTPFVEAPAFSPGRLAFVAAWGLVGLLVAVTRFRWEPSGAGPRGRRARRAAVED